MPFIFLSSVLLLISHQPTEYAEGAFPHLRLALHIRQPGALTMPFIFLSSVLLLISRQPTEYADGVFPSPMSCLTHQTTRSSDNAFHISFWCTATHLPSTNRICRRCVSLTYVSPYTLDNQELQQCLSYFFLVYCYSSPINQRNMQKVHIFPCGCKCSGVY